MWITRKEYRKLKDRVITLENEVAGLMSMCSIYNRIIQRKVDEDIGSDLIAIQKAVRKMKGGN